MLRFNILGSLEVRHQGVDCTPTAPKVRAVLALLLLRANHTVSQDAIFDWLWGDRPPRSAATTTQTYVYQLRALFERVGVAGSADQLLITRPTGYLLSLGEEQLDTTVFARLCDEGGALLDGGRAAEAAQRLRQALSLWRGPVLADVHVEDSMAADVAHLGELRMRALELRIEADARLGRYRELITELRGLVAAHPFNEWFHAQLITALNRCGRRAEALHAYRNLRQTLSDELGLEPTPELQELQRQVLNGTPARLLVAAG
ncbi:BTAD domain-containing putative transcriptional regulator [Micromonospora sp. NPDC093277]|uniref:AfsR/SARP family transcriptional regulator n=1 Tax=Micromonospora sp. NPDC093277 TaxID=3364291 RepID=UPI0038030499